MLPPAPCKRDDDDDDDGVMSDYTPDSDRSPIEAAPFEKLPDEIIEQYVGPDTYSITDPDNI